MELNELRIGNLLMCGKILTEVSSIDKVRDEFYVIDEDVFLFSSNHCNINPIPLAEQWLVRLGFVINEKKEFVFKRYSIDQPVEYVGFLFCEDKLILREVTYVHQLQNLYFALTGEELTVNN